MISNNRKEERTRRNLLLFSNKKKPKEFCAAAAATHVVVVYTPLEAIFEERLFFMTDGRVGAAQWCVLKNTPK